MDSQGYSGSRDKKSHSKYGSRDDYELGKGKEHTATMTTADKMMKDAHDAMMRSMSQKDKVKKGWRNPKVSEGAGNIGRQIKALYQKIYDQGDDAIEFMYNDSPIFAQYWDEYEGDLDSIIAEVDPKELQIIYSELVTAAEDQGIDEAYTVTRGIDRERYQERPGLEGPFSTKSGKVVYYDKVEGKYYDPDTDMYIEYDDWQAMNEVAPALVKGAAGLALGGIAAAGAPAIVGILGPLLGIPMAAYGAYSAAKLGMQGVEKLWDMAAEKLGGDDKVAQYTNAKLAKLPPEQAKAGAAVIKKIGESKQGVAEGANEKQSFKVSYHNPKTRQDKVVKIKARNKDEVLDYCANKGYRDVYVEQDMGEGAFDNYSPMAKDTIKQDKIRSLENLIAIYKKEGRQLRVQELERELSSLKNVSEGPFHNPGQEDSPVAQAITRRILLQRTDLLAKYGPEKVGQAIDEVADFVGDVDEIGSSDVSGWIRHVEQMLGNMGESQFESEGAPKSALGKALWRDLSKFKKASPVQQQRNKERWAANPHNPINKAK